MSLAAGCATGLRCGSGSPSLGFAAGPGLAGSWPGPVWAIVDGPLTATLQELHEGERAELAERAVLGFGCCFERVLERSGYPEPDGVVLLHDAHC